MAKKNEWVTRDILLEVYRRTGSIHRTADELNVGSTTITRLFKKWEIPYTPRKELPMVGLRGVPKSKEHKRKLKEIANRPEAKERARQRLLKRLPTLNGPCRNSPLEKMIETMLKEAKLSYNAQKVMLSRYVVDFLLLDYPIIIEADGSVHQLSKTKAHDKERDRLLSEAGYKTFRFTGTEINKSPAACINVVLDYIDEKIKAGEWEKPKDHEFIGVRLEVKGRNHPSFGKRRSKESIEKQRQKLIGRKQDPEVVARRNAKLRGQKHPEAGAKISKAKMGHTVSEETKRKISEKLKGRKLTAEQKKKQSEGLKRAYAEGRRKRGASEETRRKISKSLKEGYAEGRIVPVERKVSEETRALLSKINKESYANGTNGLCSVNKRRQENSKRKFSS
jgi:very-short-patch-repair endonuclease